jgi:hypothetical protein
MAANGIYRRSTVYDRRIIVLAPLPVMLLASIAVGWSGDAQLLVDTIEAVQQPIGDFQCEFEGKIRLCGERAKEVKADSDGLYETFSGVFVWKTGGDTHCESLHRRAPNDRITRESLVVRPRESRAEHYSRPNDGPIGVALIENPKQVNSWRPNCLGLILLIDQIKRDASNNSLEASVGDGEIDGRRLKTLSISLRNVPDSLMRRYWIDLDRNGHVVRVVEYNVGRVLSRLEIKLAAFRVGVEQVWMPVYGVKSDYLARIGKEHMFTKEPTCVNTIYVVDGTMELNRHPGPEVFTIKYRPGTPVSDRLRKLTYEFGQQKIDQMPTRADAEKMLDEAVFKAEAQKAELVVASSSEGFDWASALSWSAAALVVISSVALTIQRRRS